MPSILFGSISTLADTSELQRSAFNAAFAEHDLGWTWSQEEYADLLQGNGGADRVAQYAEARGEDVDAAAVHATKSRIFQESLGEGVEPRPGVAETIAAAKEQGSKVALVTTTSPENVAALLAGLADDVPEDAFDVVVDATDVSAPKPDPAAYAFALESLGEGPDEAVAIEDNVGGVASASAAGLAVVAFPNENTAGHDFSQASSTTDRLDLDDLSRLAGSR